MLCCVSKRTDPGFTYDRCSSIVARPIKLEKTANEGCPAEDAPAILLPCAICARTFMPQSLEKHSKICERAVRKKRKPFDSAKQRIQGTELAEFLPKQEKKRHFREDGSSSRRSSWKQSHDDFLRAIRAARCEKVASASSRQANSSMVSKGAPTRSNEQGSCPTCHRRFGIKAYERHVAWCKERATRVPLGPTTNIAKERLEARIKYRAPPLKNLRQTNREKYSPGSAIALANGKKISLASASAKPKETISVPSCVASNDAPLHVGRPQRAKESSSGPSGPMKSRLMDRSGRSRQSENESESVPSSRPVAKSIKRASRLPLPPPRDEKKPSDAKSQMANNIVSARSRGNPKLNDATINAEVLGLTVQPCTIHEEQKTTWKQISEEKTPRVESRRDESLDREYSSEESVNSSWSKVTQALNQTYLIRDSLEDRSDRAETSKTAIEDGPRIEFYLQNSEQISDSEEKRFSGENDPPPERSSSPLDTNDEEESLDNYSKIDSRSWSSTTFEWKFTTTNPGTEMLCRVEGELEDPSNISIDFKPETFERTTPRSTRMEEEPRIARDAEPDDTRVDPLCEKLVPDVVSGEIDDPTNDSSEGDPDFPGKNSTSRSQIFMESFVEKTQSVFDEKAPEIYSNYINQYSNRDIDESPRPGTCRLDRIDDKIRTSMSILRDGTDSLVSSTEAMNFADIKRAVTVEIETIEEIRTTKPSSGIGILPDIKGALVPDKEESIETQKINFETYRERAVIASRNRLINIDPPTRTGNRLVKRNSNSCVLPPVVLPPVPCTVSPVTKQSGKDYDPFLLAEQQMNDLLSDTSDQSAVEVCSLKQNRDVLFPLSLSSAFVEYPYHSSPRTPNFSSSDKRGSLIAPPMEFDDLVSDFSSDSTDTMSREVFLNTEKNLKEPRLIEDSMPRISDKKSRELGRRVIIDKSKALGGGEIVLEKQPTRGSKSFVGSTERARKILDRVSPKVVRPSVDRSCSLRVSSAPKSTPERKSNDPSNAKRTRVEATRARSSSVNQNNNYVDMSGSNLSLNSIVSTELDIKRSNSVFDELMNSFEDENGSFPSLRSFFKNDSFSASSPLQGRLQRNGRMSDEDLSSPEICKRQDQGKLGALGADSAYGSLNRKYSNGRSTNDVATPNEDEASTKNIARDTDGISPSATNYKLSKYCHECGSKFPETAKFCCECGIKRLAI